MTTREKLSEAIEILAFVVVLFGIIVAICAVPPELLDSAR